MLYLIGIIELQVLIYLNIYRQYSWCDIYHKECSLNLSISIFVLSFIDIVLQKSIAMMYKIRSNNSVLWFRVITLIHSAPEEVRSLGKKREEPQFQ